jgi:glycosyltransferase involved in cell wall biosynthesis
MVRSVLVLGPSRSAVSGVSTHLNQLFGCSLGDEYRLVHFRVGSEGRNEWWLDKFIRLLWSPIALAGRLIVLRPALVHINTSMDTKAFWRDAAYLIVARLFRRKVVYQVHGGELPDVLFGASGLKMSIARRLLLFPDAIVLLSEAEQTVYQKMGQFKRILVIPNAIDVAIFEPPEGKAFDSGTLKLGYIGRLVETKGILEAIESVKLLRQRGVEGLNLTVAGSGPGEAVCRERVRALGLEDWVSFVGPLFGDGKLRFWRDLDIFVFPSYHPEGLPYTILESLASGTPMVTSRAGGIPDAVVDGVHGFFVEPRNPLRQMSVACIKTAREHYSVERLAGQFSSLYGAVLA